jgi:hydroxyacylglutathione hydrolase
MPMTEIVTISSKFGTINSFLLIEDQIIIVDSGYGNHYKKIINYFRVNQIDKSLVSLIILTHAHLDHYDNVIKLKDYFQAPILVNKKAEKHFLNGTNEFTEPKNILAMILKILFYKAKLNNIDPDITIENEFSISKYGVNGTVLSTPGHTAGSLSIIINKNECLSGDLYINLSFNEFKSAWFINNNEQYLNSIIKLKELKIRKIFPSHGKPYVLK